MSLGIVRGDVWTVTLDRPERANALSAELVEALHGVLDEAASARPEALVLRGNDRHFAAGFDLGGSPRRPMPRWRCASCGSGCCSSG
ncbi:enoyl-CoA hydratase-related protein [Nocardioides humi]|uniref:enoyl-CoA hydratase-related protein n=1 Tax=Nocardioides humi TaxID=449461 RepID=UPI001C643987|nr:enoyl-CoA hydratase-related protein [Nocardioides humi]